MADYGGDVYRFFRERLPAPVAAGIVGNTQQESGNDPNAPGGGLIQGQGGRTSRGSLHEQLEGVWRELNGPERGTLQALRGARDPRTAARIFSQRFERPGVPMLEKREQYALDALRRYGGINPAPARGAAVGGALGGSPGTPGSVSLSPGGLSGAQSADLMQIVSQLSGSSGNPNSVEGISLPKPGEAAAQGPHAPRDLSGLTQPPASSAALLSLIDKIGEDAAPSTVETTPGEPGRPASPGYAPAGSQAHTGGPLAGLLPQGAMLKIGRIDEGQDGQTNPGGAILANGHGEVVAVKSDPGGFGPSYPLVVFHDGPLAGLGPIYFGHTLAAKHAGDKVNPGDVISHTGTHGVGNATTPGWFEIGLGNTIGQGNQGQGARIAKYLTHGGR